LTWSPASKWVERTSRLQKIGLFAARDFFNRIGQKPTSPIHQAIIRSTPAAISYVFGRTTERSVSFGPGAKAALIAQNIVIFVIGFATGAIVAHRTLLAGATPALGKSASIQSPAVGVKIGRKVFVDRRQAPQTCEWVTNSPPRDRGDKLPAVPPQGRGYLNFITLLPSQSIPDEPSAVVHSASLNTWRGLGLLLC
jgi:hypothetical protein